MSDKLNLIKDHTPIEKPWYSEGLRFKCTGCGQCCTGAPGYIWVNEDEIKEIADYLKLSISDFSKRYLRNVYGRLSLTEFKKTYDCVFLKDGKCTVYPVRPKQCRTFPWWPLNMKSEDQWNQAAKHCEGINHPEAPIIPYETIQDQLEQQQKYSQQQ